MKNLASLLLVAAAAVVLASSPLAAQQKRVSPHETISTVVHGDRIMVIYGRPYSKDPHSGQVRKIWGTLVPYGEVWRTGADEATLLVIEKPIVIGGTTLPSGAYSLWTLLNGDGSAKLLINKQVGQWGIKGHNAPANYDPSRDAARADLKLETLATPVDQFTIAIEKDGVLKLSWETTQFSAPFTVAK